MKKNAPDSTIGQPVFSLAVVSSRRVKFLRSPISAFIILLYCFFLSLPGSSEETSPTQTANAQPAPQPTSTVNLSDVGYHGLGEMARLASQANVSVDFVDSKHVLFTFNPKKLFKRLPDCPPTHDDRIIRAVIFEVPSGKVVRQADWYLHDNRRYLWPLGSGRFLLRRLNTLYIVDSDLHEKLLMTSPKDFLWLAVTPDGKQILVETTRDAQPSKKKDPPDSVPKLKVQIDFLDVDTLAVQRTIKSDGIVNLEATSTGFTDVSHGMSGKIWLIRFGPNAQTRKDIARVRSRCIPDTFYPSSNTILIGRCSATGPDYSVSAFTVTGHRLWRQRWSQHRYVPKISGSEDGSRFALSTLQRVMPDASTKTDADDDSTDPGIKQHIQIFDTATGTPVLSVDTSPVVLSAQNFSFAPDGSRVAMLGQTSLEIYDLPKMSEDERSKYSAVKADVPGLYMPASEPSLSMATGDADDSTFSAAQAVTGPDAGPDAAPGSDQAKTAGNPAAAAEAKANAGAANAAPPTAANPKKDDSDVTIPTFKASTHVVVVDVVVTDRKGHPVTGLQQKDFQVAEDGKGQTVRSFDEIKTQPNGANTPAPAVPKSAPEIAASTPPQIASQYLYQQFAGSGESFFDNHSAGPSQHSTRGSAACAPAIDGLSQEEAGSLTNGAVRSWFQPEVDPGFYPRRELADRRGERKERRHKGSTVAIRFWSGNEREIGARFVDSRWGPNH